MSTNPPSVGPPHIPDHSVLPETPPVPVGSGGTPPSSAEIVAHAALSSQPELKITSDNVLPKRVVGTPTETPAFAKVHELYKKMHKELYSLGGHPLFQIEYSSEEQDLKKMVNRQLEINNYILLMDDLADSPEIKNDPVALKQLQYMRASLDFDLCLAKLKEFASVENDHPNALKICLNEIKKLNKIISRLPANQREWAQKKIKVQEEQLLQKYNILPAAEIKNEPNAFELLQNVQLAFGCLEKLEKFAVNENHDPNGLKICVEMIVKLNSIIPKLPILFRDDIQKDINEIEEELLEKYNLRPLKSSEANALKHLQDFQPAAERLERLKKFAVNKNDDPNGLKICINMIIELNRIIQDLPPHKRGNIQATIEKIEVQIIQRYYIPSYRKQEGGIKPFEFMCRYECEKLNLKQQKLDAALKKSSPDSDKIELLQNEIANCCDLIEGMLVVEPNPLFQKMYVDAMKLKFELNFDFEHQKLSKKLQELERAQKQGKVDYDKIEILNRDIAKQCRLIDGLLAMEPNAKLAAKYLEIKNKIEIIGNFECKKLEFKMNRLNTVLLQDELDNDEIVIIIRDIANCCDLIDGLLSIELNDRLQEKYLDLKKKFVEQPFEKENLDDLIGLKNRLIQSGDPQLILIVEKIKNIFIDFFNRLFANQHNEAFDRKKILDIDDLINNIPKADVSLTPEARADYVKFCQEKIGLLIYAASIDDPSALFILIRFSKQLHRLNNELYKQVFNQEIIKIISSFVSHDLMDVFAMNPKEFIRQVKDNGTAQEKMIASALLFDLIAHDPQQLNDPKMFDAIINLLVWNIRDLQSKEAGKALLANIGVLMALNNDELNEKMRANDQIRELVIVVAKDVRVDKFVAECRSYRENIAKLNIDDYTAEQCAKKIEELSTELAALKANLPEEYEGYEFKLAVAETTKRIGALRKKILGIL